MGGGGGGVGVVLNFIYCVVLDLCSNYLLRIVARLCEDTDEDRIRLISFEY